MSVSASANLSSVSAMSRSFRTSDLQTVLESRLKAPEQLSAIFNWALEGYKILKATRKFTEPDDQKKTTQDFIEVTNPIVVFVKEFRIEDCRDNSITNADLYRNYCMWCDDSRHKALAKTSFDKRLPKAFRSIGTI